MFQLIWALILAFSPQNKNMCAWKRPSANLSQILTFLDGHSAVRSLSDFGIALPLGTHIGDFGDVECVAHQNLPSLLTLTLLGSVRCSWVTSVYTLMFVRRPLFDVDVLGFFLHYDGRALLCSLGVWGRLKPALIPWCYFTPMLL